MKSKYEARKRRSVKTTAIIRQSKRPRLVVSRSILHIYAQIIICGDKGDEVIVSASTMDKELKTSLTGDKRAKAAQVGKLLADRAKQKNITIVGFDRAGNKYHGRIKALAEAAREAGLDF